MKNIVTEYLDLVCAQIKSKQIRLSARAELMSHIQAASEKLMQSGLDEDEALKTALYRMGNPVDTGKQICSSNAPWQNIASAAAGIILLFLVLASGMYEFRSFYLFNFKAFIFVSLLTLSFVLIGGLSRLTRLSALTRGRTAALYAGGIGMIKGLVKTLGYLGDPENFGIGLAFCITSLLYGLIVSAVLTSIAHLLRPLESSEIRKILGWDDL
ncbi:MAG: permease prefix domain 1-containing protein [Treponema sp.]|nr:permease prefix domain 1-containing protein [Treponema sp.]